MSTAVIVVILVVVCIFSIKSYAKRLSQGCCGGGDVPKRARVKHNKADYKYCVSIAIDGMTCNHCKARVENALNSLNGVWAEVNLSKKTALVRMRERLSDEELKNAVVKEGYTVENITQA